MRERWWRLQREPRTLCVPVSYNEFVVARKSWGRRVGDHLTNPTQLGSAVSRVVARSGMLNSSHVVAALVGGSLTLLLLRTKKRALPAWCCGRFEPLKCSTLPSCPFELLNAWINEAEAALGFLESHAMVVATGDFSEGPTARTVVLQVATSELGLMFGSSRSSLKGRQAIADGRAECVLRHGQRQVRIRGVLRLDDSKSAESFQRVAPSARVGLQALKQGAPINEHGWAQLGAEVNVTARSVFSGPPAPPEDYTAFVLVPRTFEFYNGGHPSYLNDRFLYVRDLRGDSLDFEVPVRLQS